AARSLGHPLWCRPWRPAVAASAWPGFPAQHADLELLALRSAAAGSGDGLGDVLVTLQNLGPCRRRLELGRRWQFVERLDGLDQPLPQLPDSSDPLVLGPWGIGFWRLRRSG
ncbi:MAG: alpha-mannosidase, partial [Cyanobacteriota bacterium]